MEEAFSVIGVGLVAVGRKLMRSWVDRGSECKIYVEIVKLYINSAFEVLEVPCSER